jgi:uncharacterized damage-inducible protein DinB
MTIAGSRGRPGTKEGAAGMVERPGDDEYGSFYQGYVARVSERDVLAVLEAQPRELARAAAGVSAERESFCYAPGKWSVRQVFGHLADAERVFGYRAFCLSRGDATPLPGFEENAYVAESRSSEERLEELARTFATVREANLTLLRRLDARRWARRGVANGNPVSVRALAFIMAGHVRHHLAVLRERYDVGADA